VNLISCLKVKYPNSLKFTDSLVVVDFENVHKYCSEHNVYDNESLFNIRPPFEVFFMQYDMFGFYFEKDSDNGLHYLAEAFVWLEDTAKLLGSFDFNIKESGYPDGICFMFPDSSPEQTRKLTEFLPYLRGTFHHALYAIQFMHCKNVTLAERESGAKVSRQVKRQMERKNISTESKYYILNIEPLKQTLKTEGDIEHNGFKKALHICRGHFRNYEEGKGLFGKYHGQYWVPAHVKGDKKNGEIIKDYNIKL
jgi:hypothetical protein